LIELKLSPFTINSNLNDAKTDKEINAKEHVVEFLSFIRFNMGCNYNKKGKERDNGLTIVVKTLMQSFPFVSAVKSFAFLKHFPELIFKNLLSSKTSIIRLQIFY